MHIYDGRDSFYQWDLNQKIADRTFEVGEEVHVFSLAYPEAMIVKAYSYNGEIVIDVPNILLQKSYSIFIYRCEEDNGVFCTYAKYEFIVNQRPKPPDYVYTQTEVLRYENLDKRLTELENSSGGSVTIELDTTLSEAGKAADAKATGDTIRSLSEKIANVADEVDALSALSECGIITPAYQDGTFYTDADGAIYVL